MACPWFWIDIVEIFSILVPVGSIMDFKIYFRGLSINDAPAINQLRLNEQYEKMIVGSRRFVPLERDQKWLEDIILKDEPSRMYMAVCEKGTDEFIGYTSIHEIDYINGRCCWSGLKIIPKATKKLAKKLQAKAMESGPSSINPLSRPNKGYGIQVGLLILKYLFEELRMIRCWSVCLIDNHASKNVLDKVGFKTEGVMRNYSYKNGTANDAYLVSVTIEDYKTIKKNYAL